MGSIGDRASTKKIRLNKMANKPKIVLCDIDGTVADISHREHYLINKDQKGRTNWKAFFSEMNKDTVREEIRSLLYDCYCVQYAPCEVVFLTGRPEDYRDVTEKWLEDNRFYYTELHMRPKGDRRPDWIVKSEAVLTLLEKYDIMHALDDRRPVINMLKEKNIRIYDAGCEKRKDLNL